MTSNPKTSCDLFDPAVAVDGSSGAGGLEFSGGGLQAMVEGLREQYQLYGELLEVVRRENEALRAGGEFGGTVYQQARKALLPRLTDGLDSLRRYSAQWRQLDPAARARMGEMGRWLQASQETIMSILVLDRENEQWLVKRGLGAPPPVSVVPRQPPHCAAEIYRRTAGIVAPG